MKLSNFPLLIFVFIVSCHNESETSLISKWKVHSKEHVFERKVASLPKNRCVRDLYTVDELKKTVKEFEDLYSDAPKLTGKWKHLNLSDLPVSQSSFLIKYGSVIGDRSNPDAIDYSSCNDVPCILNMIYGKEDHQNGFVHYLWYLKFGHLLAADNMIPRQSSSSPGVYQEKNFELSQYLFSDDEIFGFWRLFLMLEPAYVNIPTLKEIQRIPSGTWMEKNVPQHCGNAGMDGYIVLMDGCLRKPETEMGDFYFKVTHEMAHHIDFSRGREQKPALPYFSRGQEYLNLSGIEKVEYQDESGKTQIKFEPKEGAKFVSDYSKKSPAETFAESLSYFRFSGERTKSILTKEHFDFIKDKVYDGKDYTNSGHWDRWETKYTPYVRENSLKLILKCLKGEDIITEGEDYLGRSDLPQGLPLELSSCLQKNSKTIGLETYGKILSTEPEGCVLMSWESNKIALHNRLKKMVQDSFSESLSTFSFDPEYISKLSQLFSEEDTAEARQIFLRCRLNEQCFEQHLDLFAVEKSNELEISSVETVQKMYRSYYTFKSVGQDVTQFYRILLEGYSNVIISEAKSLWSLCITRPPSDTEIVSSLNNFTVKQGYMVSSLYNCLNEGMESHAVTVLDNVHYQGLSLRDTYERAYLTPQVFALLKSELEMLYEKESGAEKIKVIEFLRDHTESEAKRIRTKLLDFSWANVGEVRSGCYQKTLDEITFPIYFSLKKDAFKSIQDKVSCHSLTSSQEFHTWTETNKTKLTEAVFAHAEKSILRNGEELVKSCRSRASGLFSGREFNNCINDAWDTLEQQVSLIESRLDITYRLQISQAQILQYFKKHKKIWIKRLRKNP